MILMGFRDPHSDIVLRQSFVVCDMSTAVSAYFVSEPVSANKTRFLPLRHEIAISMVNDAALLPKSITKALGSNSKEKRLKELRLINIRLRNLLSYCNGLEKDGVKEKEYVHLLRKEINSFRKSFKAWRTSLL